MDNLTKHKEYIITAFLLFFCFVLYWLNIGNFAFIDTDETKFVSIAKDMLNNSGWITPKLEGENYFEYPPLIYWLINFCCIIFGKINTEIVRLPFAISSTICIFSIFTTLKNILSKSSAIIITLVFATSFGVLIFSRLATIDFLFSVFLILATLTTFKIIFNEEKKNEIIYWIQYYIFVALATLTVGLLGIIMPIILTSIMLIFSGKLKKFFNPINKLLGILILVIMLLPWHFLMFQKHNITFLNNYLSPLNFLNSISIKSIVEVIALFLIGFIPWSFSLIWAFFARAKDIFNTILSYLKDNSQNKLSEKWSELTKKDKFLSLNTICLFVIFIFAIAYSGNNLYTTLCIIFPASCISGIYWNEHIINKKHDTSIFFSTIIPCALFIIASLICLFGHNVINTALMDSLNYLIIPLIVIFFVIPLFSIFSAILKGRIPSFISNIIFMICISVILTQTFFNFMIINGGENDLIKFAQFVSKEQKELTAYIPSKKHSLTYYYDNKVNFKHNKDLEWLKQYLENNKEAYVIVEIKDLWDIEDKQIPYMLIDTGKRYCLIQHMPTELIEENTEAKIFEYNKENKI